MSETVDVSVVLPIYNAEKYLDQALSSIEVNSRVSLEIICVNDGSTDSSLTIMLDHAAHDPRIRVIDKPNQGYGASVNRGFSEARGTYLAIVEPDDYLDGPMYDDLFEFAELQSFMDMPLKNYSSGMVARIAFAIATITEPDILIVGETLSVGDYLFQQKCERRIQELVQSGNVTVLLVSHSIELVKRICNRVCWIEKGQMRMVGPTDEVCEEYESLGK